MAKKNLSLRQLEAEVYSGNHSAAVATFAAMLDRMDRMGPQALLRSQTGDRKDALNIYSRLAALIGAMLADPRLLFGDELLTVFMLHKRTIGAIFRVTTFGNMDHVVALSASEKSPDQAVTRSSVYKGMVAASIDSPILNPEGVMKQLQPRERAMFWMSLLDRDYYLTNEDEEKRRQVIGLSHMVEDGFLSDPFLVRLSNVWMNSSYFNDPAKHEVKRALNKIFRNSMKTIGVKAPSFPEKREISKKPRLAILSEQLRHQHAMYRCYGPAIEQLIKRFDVVLVTANETVDEKCRALFDEVVSFPLATPIEEVIKKVLGVKADLIYFPSIGMQGWTTAACQLRLAPIQLMTLGHPATSMSDNIDYVVVRERSIGDPSCFSETVVLTDNDAFAFTFHPEIKNVGRSTSRPGDVVKIAVPSNGNKLCAALFECCEEVARRVTKKIEFQFYPNMPEAQTIELQTLFEHRFPCKFHMGTDYVSYMKMIGECAFQLSPFPFGNANGYVDGLLMGLPIVSMNGPEVHSHADNVMGRLAGLPEFCLTENLEEYQDAIVRLVENEDERIEISERLLELDLEPIFFTKKVTSDFADAVQWIHENHEQIQKMNKKCWSVEDRSNGKQQMKAEMF